MTKAQAARRINGVFKEYNRIPAETLNEILKDADMRYGDIDTMERSLRHRNGGNLTVEGPILGRPEAGRMLRTRKELGFQEKPSRETLKRKTRYNRHKEMKRC